MLIVSGVRAQSLSDSDFQSLIQYVQTENWESALKKSSYLLQSTNTDTSDAHARILYVNIFSAVGMAAEGKMTFGELEEIVMQFQGQKIIMPGHNITWNGRLGYTKFHVTDTSNYAFTAAANAKGINILCFEKFLFKEKYNPGIFPEKSVVSCGGTLEKIDINRSKSKLWILRLTVTDAFARKID